MISRTSLLIPISIALLALVTPIVGDGQAIGCYSSLPSSYVFKNSYTWQSSQHCADSCSDYDFFALYNGNECYCGSTYPSGEETSSSCSSTCVGYSQEYCGGDSAYNILAQNGVDVASYSDSASTSSSTESSTESSTSTSSSSGTQVSAVLTTSSTSSTESSSAESLSTLSSSTESSSTEVTSTSSTDSSTSSEDTTVVPTTSSSTSTSTSSSSSTSTSSPTTSSASSSTKSPTVTQEKMTSLLTTILENSSATVTNIVYITQSASNSPSSSSKSSNSSSVNKGALIGGIVGGVLGFLTILFAVLFLLRHRIFSRYSDDEHSIIADDVAYEEALRSHNENPFASEEDKEADKILLGRRRLSDGSLADATDYSMKVLRVANPDDED